MCLSLQAMAQKQNYSASQNIKSPPKIDGSFEDAAWGTIEWTSDFTQYEPNNGAEPSQRTAFKLLYDNSNIYVAIKNYDLEAEMIEGRMTRRDGYEGDMCGIHFDSYYDKRTAFAFLVNAAGVKNDGIFTDDGENYDPSLDPIWFVETKIMNDGWNAEMKIPLSQLRFGKGENLVWGMQVLRTIFRSEEMILWNAIDNKKPGWISNYGMLSNLKNLSPKKQIELAPYVLTKLNKYEAEPGNPYADGLDMGLDGGLDAKIGLTNDFILDLAINPDFGQVEADPSEVNLSVFETYFNEKRPFFIEGTNITNFQLTPGGNPWASDNLFYSRRVGRSPQFSPEPEQGEYIDSPINVRILGAAKLTGKSKNGWSVGIIENLVDKGIAHIATATNEKALSIEPMTNYFLARVLKDIDHGNTLAGGMITATNRFISDDHLLFLPKAAYTGGFDLTQYFMDKKYFISGSLVGSALLGTKEAIAEQQLSSRRYFQRPDADYLEYDENKTSLFGHGGTVMFGKASNSGFRFLINTTYRSPGLELNDLGYLRRADNVFHFIWAGYKFINPMRGIRNIDLNANEWAGWDFGGTNLFKGLNLNLNVNASNFWEYQFNITREFSNIDNAELRGGPAFYYPGGGDLNLGFSTNSKKKMTLEAQYSFGWSDHEHSERHYAEIELFYRPINTLALVFEPSYSIRDMNLQFVDVIEMENAPLYLFSNLRQQTLSFTIRVDYNITPDFTLQYYASPFIAAGLYDGFKKITDADAVKYLDRYNKYNSNQVLHEMDLQTGVDRYVFDDNGDMLSDFVIDNPDFNFKQFRSNLVARWEYIPGSVLYLVWAQGRTDIITDGSFNIGRDLKSLFSISPDDVFLLKFSYRIRLDDL